MRTVAFTVSVAVFAILFLALTKVAGMNILASFAISISPALLSGIFVLGLLTKRAYLLKLQDLEAKRREIERIEADHIAQMHRTIDLIRAEIPEVSDLSASTGQNLTKICDHAELILQKVSELTPNSKTRSALGIRFYLDPLHEKVLHQYIEMMTPNRQQYFPNWEVDTQKTEEVIAHIEEYLRGTVTTLEKGQLDDLTISLGMIDPYEKSFPV